MTPEILPQEVDDVRMMFGGKAMELLPPWADIPKEFKRHGGTPWNEVVSTWFFTGFNFAILTPKSGIDKSKALRHLRTCMGSFEPQHEHKEAGCAYLMSLWFEPLT